MTDSEQVPWGKDEKNFGKRVKQYVKLLVGKRLKSVMSSWIQPYFCLVYFLDGRPACILTIGKRHWKCDSFRCVIVLCCILWLGCNIQHALWCLCWRNGFKRPVLKHGPRSLPCMQVFEWKTQGRNESDGWESLVEASTPAAEVYRRWWGRACRVGPERWWTMPA